LYVDGSTIKQEPLQGYQRRCDPALARGNTHLKKQSNLKESFYQMTSLFNFFFLPSFAAVSRVHEKEKLCHPISSSFSPTLR
jgi:hypothetical protein